MANTIKHNTAKMNKVEHHGQTYYTDDDFETWYTSEGIEIGYTCWRGGMFAVGVTDDDGNVIARGQGSLEGPIEVTDETDPAFDVLLAIWQAIEP